MGPGDPERACREAAVEGIISGACARALGMTQAQIDWLVSRGRWNRVCHDTYVIDGTPDSFRRSAAIASSSGAVCSHRCAAALYGLDGVRPREIEVVALSTFPPTRFSSSALIHRTNHLPDTHIGERFGMPVTSVARTLIDLAGVLPFRVMRRAAISAVDRSLVSPDQIAARLRCCGRSGRPGVANVRRFMEEMDWDEDLSDSDLEDIAYGLIVKEGLPSPRRLFNVYQDGVFLGELDLAYPALKIGVEVDSFRYHGSQPDFVRDRGRSNGLVAEGWRILHFVYEDHLRPRRFLTALKKALNTPPIQL